ncbi:MAG: leucine-rich repeat protein [Desulfobacterales bacterium]|nr:leucine-rich repeat protein [Desulfobacterales bacterium]
MSNIPKHVIKKIKEVKEKQLKELDLSWKYNQSKDEKLTQIPTEVFELEQLEVLNLRSNQLTAVPDSISRLQNLTSLVLSRNKLTAVPDSITRLQNLTSLVLSRNKLTAVPDSITRLQNLTSLVLGVNQLTAVPDSITRLQILTSLALSSHKLTAVPDSFTRLQNLTSLVLSNNQLTAVPDSVTRLQNLTSLDLNYNQLTAVPDSITRLQNLTSLVLSYNQLTAVPDSISQLQNLTSFDLSDNKLSTIPDSIFQLQNLTSLDLWLNQFTTIPESITQLQNLISLNFSNNLLTYIPSYIYNCFSLQKLSLHNKFASIKGNNNKNQIKEISPKILQLKNLKELALGDNPIEIPPPEVVKKGVKAIKDYFLQIEAKGKDHLYEAKLLIVGEAGAGKTTLAKKIENQAYKLQDNETSTEGIDVIHWQFPMENGQQFKVNIWDFGGQEIYHSTHQFFLTKRSMYALVADTRKEDTDFYYWLNVVELLSDNSPMLIIKNEKQNRHREINERQLRGEFANLEKTLATNLATNRGLPQILSEIKHYISNLSHIGAALPKTWVDVRKTLENDPRNYISVEEYLDICEQNGFTRKEDKLQLSGYLHDLGVSLHFQQDPLLKKTVILNPTWGTDAVYAALDNKKVIRSLGRFNKTDLAKIWHDKKYADMHDELLQLMINFQLCYKIPGTLDTYIAPQLLSENQPKYNWPEKNNIILRYTYEFMPKGIITRFIVAMHNQIADHKHVWKTGVILKKDKIAAEVIEYYGKREIKIRIAGNHKKELMTIVTYELDKIHDSYNRLKYNKWIPCNCVTCKDSQEPYFYPLITLRKFTADRQERIQCQNSYQMVDVLGLIDDVLDRRQFLEQENRKSQGVIIRGDIENLVIQQSEEGNNIMEDKNKDNVKVRSAWANGSFYLFTFAVVIILLGVLAKTVPWQALPVILIAGGIFVPLVGVFQLRQDDRLTEKSFTELMKLVVGQLPLIGKSVNQQIEQ